MQLSDSMADLIAQIGNYDNSVNAIGYSYLYYVDSLYKSGSLKVLILKKKKVPPVFGGISFSLTG